MFHPLEMVGTRGNGVDTLRARGVMVDMRGNGMGSTVNNVDTRSNGVDTWGNGMGTRDVPFGLNSLRDWEE